MRRNKVLCSSSVLIGRVNNHDFGQLKDIVRQIDCDGFELMMYHTKEWIDDVAPYFRPLAECGVDFYSMHMSKNIGEMISRNNECDIDAALILFRENCEFAKQMGVKLLVLHLWGGLPSDKHIDVNIAMYPKLYDISCEYGFILTVENIVCNTYKPLSHMAKLHELYPDKIKFTIDVRQAEFHKSVRQTCETPFLWQNPVVPHIHISDFAGGEMEWEKLNPVLSPGEGLVDFDYFFKFLCSINYSGSFTLEGASSIDYEKINNSLNFIRKNMEMKQYARKS